MNPCCACQTTRLLSVIKYAVSLFLSSAAALLTPSHPLPPLHCELVPFSFPFLARPLPLSTTCLASLHLVYPWLPLSDFLMCFHKPPNKYKYEESVIGTKHAIILIEPDENWLSFFTTQWNSEGRKREKKENISTYSALISHKYALFLWTFCLKATILAGAAAETETEFV